jgi:ferrous iron transport protein A
MTQAAFLPLDSAHSRERAREEPSSRSDLSGMAVGQTARVIELALDADLAAWLRAVGISEGEGVTVLRRAAFGGPIHVRTSSGGEFALHRALARSVMTRPLSRGAHGEESPA